MCGELRRSDIGAQVCVQGWVWHRRDMGGLIFVDLRDRAGAVQCVFNPDAAPEAHTLAESWRPEYVVEIEGEVVARSPENVNPQLETGEVEILVRQSCTLATAEPPPFLIESESGASEEARLRYRYLDLRRPPLQRAMVLRHRLAMATRRTLDEQGFLEIETPVLTKSTPEGARDYLVPSRVSPGYFYALPQSPQLFKQLLMVAGFDRYFQIVRCFRDEDLRADRQPEFTQIDIEMSFVSPEDVQELTEILLRRLLEAAGLDSGVDFERLTYDAAMERFGTDRPDLRYGNELVNVTEIFEGSSFRAFASVAEGGGKVRALRVPGCAGYGRSRLDQLTDQAREHGAKGLVWLQLVNGEVKSAVANHVGEEALAAVVRASSAEHGDLVLLIGDDRTTSAHALGALRTSLAREEGWIEDSTRFAWITDFPLFESTGESGRLVACHHPFTAPKPKDLDQLETKPLAVRAQAYDLVLNGVELGGGSVRIHQEEVQRRVFTALGVSTEEAEDKFEFFFRALRYGAPPHGGIALGFDRIIMLLSGTDSLRGTMAFPKTARAADLLTEAPSTVHGDQLRELHISVETPADDGGGHGT